MSMLFPSAPSNTFQSVHLKQFIRGSTASDVHFLTVMHTQGVYRFAVRAGILPNGGKAVEVKILNEGDIKKTNGHIQYKCTNIVGTTYSTLDMDTQEHGLKTWNVFSVDPICKMLFSEPSTEQVM